jgi:hypothetical protein
LGWRCPAACLSRPVLSPEAEATLSCCDLSLFPSHARHLLHRHGSPLSTSTSLLPHPPPPTSLGSTPSPFPRRTSLLPPPLSFAISLLFPCRCPLSSSSQVRLRSRNHASFPHHALHHLLLPRLTSSCLPAFQPLAAEPNHKLLKLICLDMDMPYVTYLGCVVFYFLPCSNWRLPSIPMLVPMLPPFPHVSHPHPRTEVVLYYLSIQPLPSFLTPCMPSFFCGDCHVGRPPSFDHSLGLATFPCDI